MSDRTLPPEALDAWAAAVRDKLALDHDLPVALVLDLARDVANGVARPAAPLSAFAAGLAAGRAGGWSVKLPLILQDMIIPGRITTGRGWAK